MTATCQREGCGRPATGVPRICVPARKGGPSRVSSILTLPVCVACRAQLTAADYIGQGDPGREHLRQAFSLYADGRFIDFEFAWIEWLPLDHPHVVIALRNEARAQGRPH